MSNATFDVGRLTKLIIIYLVLPVTLALFGDLAMGLMPWLTLVVSVLAIPLASIVVTRASLAELDKIIEKLAPIGELGSNEIGAKSVVLEPIDAPHERIG
jgi:hypothetical protein